ncbi:hypothetical protein PMAYCL1PPCAC_02676, partial [Pristionchus mayeri]
PFCFSRVRRCFSFSFDILQFALFSSSYCSVVFFPILVSSKRAIFCCSLSMAILLPSRGSTFAKSMGASLGILAALSSSSSAFLFFFSPTFLAFG